MKIEESAMSTGLDTINTVGVPLLYFWSTISPCKDGIEQSNIIRYIRLNTQTYGSEKPLVWGVENKRNSHIVIQAVFTSFEKGL